jgi:GTPase Era involved in 16S rRNA processing
VDVRIGHRLLSCTDEVRAVRCQHPSKDGDIVLVDTPGFDDTFKSDAQILEQIANWLKDTSE